MRVVKYLKHPLLFIAYTVFGREADRGFMMHEGKRYTFKASKK